ncbi:MAG TPA: 50S ribosomal protein L19e [Thermoplasmataceae archaeon]|nr:50S ribosomal protein L19e [Thermoplasmatales archaeon AK]HLH86011.1 50S ribosomal protein L19e [Thermoplasmataceae archaeon]
MRIETAKRLAAEEFKSGTTRVWIDTNNVDQVLEAASRSDIRDLIERNVIQPRQKKGNSNFRLKKRISQRSKERRRGPGSIRGTKYARFPRKERWVKTVRALRDELRKLKADGTVNSREYRRFYLEIKGGSIRSRAQLVSHVKTSLGRGDK